MNALIIILRLIHIFFGVFWVGSTFSLAAFIEPTSEAMGSEGGKFMQRLVSGGMTMELAFAGPATVLAGLLLYLIDSSGLSLQWIATGPGITFTLGGLAGIVALLISLFVNRPVADAMTTLGKTMQSIDKPPTPEQIAQMKNLQERLTQGTLQIAFLVSLSLAAMAAARYL